MDVVVGERIEALLALRPSGTFVAAAVVATGGLMCLYKVAKFVRGWRNLSHLPGEDMGLPIIGHSRKWLTLGRRLLAEQLHDTYGPIARSNWLGESYMHVGDYKLVQYVLKNDHELVEVKSWYTLQKLLLDGGLMSLTGKRHRKIRGRVMPKFQSSALRVYRSRVQSMVSARVEKWLEESSSGSTDGIAINAEIINLTFEVAASIVLGDSFMERTQGSGKVNIIELYDRVKQGILSYPINLPWTTFGKAMAARERLIAVFYEEMKARDASAIDEPRDVIEAMMVAGRGSTDEFFTPEGLREFCLPTMFAGHDTTATALTTAMCMLVYYPDWATKLRAEIDASVASRRKANPEGVVPLADETLENLPLLSAFCVETLRIRPIVVTLVRTALVDFELGGFAVKKGTKLALDFAYATKNEPGLRDWDKFDPMRFVKQEKGFTATHLNVMFGSGQHKCLGEMLARMELRQVVAKILYDTEFELAGDLAPIETFLTSSMTPPLSLRFRRRRRGEPSTEPEHE